MNLKDVEYIVVDIETGTNPLWKMYVPEFDYDSVKTGNMVKPELIAAKKKQSAAIYWKEAEERAPLSPITGKILVIGLLYVGRDGKTKTEILDVNGDRNEKDIIEQFWDLVRKTTEFYTLFIGHNNRNFDIPYLIKRSWFYKIKIPYIFTGWKGGLSDRFVDIMEKWSVGVWDSRYISLNDLSQYLGVGSKTDEGKHFERLYFKNKEKAIEYNINDLQLIKKCYESMTVFDTPPERVKIEDFIGDNKNE